MPQKTEDGNYELSIFKGEPATENKIIQVLEKLSYAFPKMPDSFFGILTERLVAHGFTEDKLKAAVNSVIDNFKYKELNVSDIISFDKKIKLYTTNEFQDFLTKGHSSREFLIVRKNPVTFWAFRRDLIENGIDEMAYKKFNAHRDL